MKTINSKGISTVAIIGIIVIILLAGGLVWWQVGKGDNGNTNNQTNINTSIDVSNTNISNATADAYVGQQLITDGYKHEIVSRTIDGGFAVNDHLEFVSPSQQKIAIPNNVWFKIFASTAYGLSDNLENEQLISSIMPLSPSDSNIIYLSTAELLNNSLSQINNRVYSYNIVTSELKQIFVENDKNNSPVSSQHARILRTVGIDDTMIVMLIDDYNNSPGPCARIWYHYMDQMVYIDILNPSQGLGKYIVPPAKVESDRLEVEDCLQHINDI